MNPLPKPTFTTTVSALRTTDPRYPSVQPTADEAEVADVLEELQQLHAGPEDLPDDAGKYGTCTGCREPWPCAAWHYGEQLALQWLGRAADRVYAHARSAMTRGSAA